MDVQNPLPDFSDTIPGWLILAALVLFFPLIAALVAPDDRRWTFFFLTIFMLLPGPIGVGCAAIANPRTRPKSPVADGRSMQDRLSSFAGGWDWSNPFKAESDWSNPFKSGNGDKNP